MSAPLRHLLWPVWVGTLATQLWACNLTISKSESDARVDADGDGYKGSAFGGDDCDDNNKAINPGQVELCNGIDDDCDGDTDVGALDATTWIQDGDGDGWGRPDATLEACQQPEGFVASDGSPPDCDDSDAAIHPDAVELCNEVDDDCDDDVDEGGDQVWYQDADGDGHGDIDTTEVGCQPTEGTWSELGDDCDDTDAAISPEADEICGNDVDEDCSDGDAACPVINLADANIIGSGTNLNDGYGHRVVAFDDKVAVSSPNARPGVANVVLHTDPMTMGLDADNASLRISAVLPDTKLGWDIALSADLLGTGHLSLVVGAPDYDGDGLVAVFDGVPDGDQLLSSADAIILGAANNSKLGMTVAAAGDVTGGGIADLLIADPDGMVPATGSVGGIAYVIPGPLSALTDVATSWSITSTETNGTVGQSITAIDDIDGDGINEVAIAAPQTGSFAGMVYILNSPINGDVDLTDAQIQIQAHDNFEAFGYPLATGDINGDGQADLIAGAIGINISSYSSGDNGLTYVFTELSDPRPTKSTDATLTLSQESNFDSSDDQVAGLGLDASQDHDNDGMDDILIGYPRRTDDGGLGTTYLVYGGLSGTVSLSTAGARFVAPDLLDLAGRSVAATDIDGDGLIDILVGAPGPSTGSGRVFTVLGGTW